jgi:hypothetical protein
LTPVAAASGGSTIRRVWGVVALTASLAAATPGFAAERYALVVTGASGGAAYAEKYNGWRERLVGLLREQFGYPESHVLVLAETAQPGVRVANRENVRAALADLRKRATPSDLVLVLLIGHGTGFDGGEAKFNLVGPDLTAEEWASLVAPLGSRVVFVNTTSGSFPFLRTLSAQGRIVLTATDSPAQQYETVFPEYFIRAFADRAADLDKDEKVSIWEAFTYASAGVRGWFEEQGRLTTERPILDDTGDGVGAEAAMPGADGAIARVTFLQPDTVVGPTGDPVLTDLLRQRAELQSKIDGLRARRPSMTAVDYEVQLERLLLELARVDRQIRSRS